MDMGPMKKYIALAVGIVSFVYYALLSAKSWTWLFMSSDSGDWLMTSNWWVVPQPYGSPLYISLMRLIGFVTAEGVTVVVATILLSCLSSAITVMLVYLITKRMTGKVQHALVSSVVLLGCGIFLTQSTVLEQYAIAIMFCMLAFYLYMLGRRKMTALMLGLGTAAHAFVLPIALAWYVVDYLSHKNLRVSIKPAVVYITSGLLPYSLILILMYLDTPRLLAGSLNLQALDEYLLGTGGTIVGSLSLFEAPIRLLAMSKVLLMSLGLAWIPLWYGFKRPYDTKKVMLACIIVFSFWYHFTCMDPVTWTFLCFGLPSIAIIVGLGLSRLTLKHSYVVAVVALVLVCINGVFLNANTLTNERPLATTYYNELMELPNGSVVVATAGARSLGLFYVMSEHPEKDFVPVIYPYMCHDAWKFEDYGTYMKSRYGLEGGDTFELTQDALDKGMNVYLASSAERYVSMQRCFYYWVRITPQGYVEPAVLRQITGLSGITMGDLEQ